jgi:hypothetical protein
MSLLLHGKPKEKTAIPKLVTYLDFRDINVRVIESIDGASSCTSIVCVNVDRNALTGSIGTTHLKPIFFVLNDDSRTVRIIGGIWEFVVLVSLVFLDLHVVLKVSLQKVWYRRNVSSYGLISALFVALFVNRKDNHIDVIAAMIDQ